ncbi:MAG: GlsB/YeaQ/YmgE family stress response membrane protein [Nitrospiraceae bacterium]|nr:MAG: GlsB/YeaQ/YmgE family stress response membrane protein [Nitrospiraceae bacterium]
MSFIAWLFLGLLAGVAASRVVNRNGQGVVLDAALGIGGAIVCGLAYNAVKGAVVLNLFSLSVAVAGSLSFLLIYHAMFRRP